MKAKIILMLGVFFCSLSSSFVKLMNAPSCVSATYRLGWTVLLLTPVVLGNGKRRKELLSLKKQDLGFCLLSGIFLALHFFTWFESLSHTSVSSSTVLVNTEVLPEALSSPQRIMAAEAALFGEMCWRWRRQSFPRAIR